MKLTTLTDSRASLLILQVLHEKGTLDQQSLIAELENHGASQTSYKSGVRLCQEMNLIQMEQKRIHPRGSLSILHALTPKGRKVAEKILELESLLNSQEVS